MDLPAVKEEQVIGTRKSIVIPSNSEITGLKTIPFPNENMNTSWQHLNSFTDQTLENFSKGGKKGILCVHSLEDIMGVSKHFTDTWNRNHPHDQRILEGDLPKSASFRDHRIHSENFRKLFTNKEFIENYPGVLGSRPLISVSILAFNDQTAFTLGNSFAPVSFILHVPAECIALVDRKDAGTPVHYIASGDEMAKMKLSQLHDNITKDSKSNISLDALLRYPQFSTLQGYGCYAVMNEVAILNCAISEGKEYRPSIVGALYSGNYGAQYDYGNAERNILLKDEMELFCIKENIPFLTVEQPEYVSPEIVEKTVIQEWYGKEGSLQDYAKDYTLCYDNKDKNENNSFYIRDKTFLLSDAQLKGYHLERPAGTMK